MVLLHEHLALTDHSATTIFRHGPRAPPLSLVSPFRIFHRYFFLHSHLFHQRPRWTKLTSSPPPKPQPQKIGGDTSNRIIAVSESAIVLDGNCKPSWLWFLDIAYSVARSKISQVAQNASPSSPKVARFFPGSQRSSQTSVCIFDHV